jgi:protein TonB
MKSSLQNNTVSTIIPLVRIVAFLTGGLLLTLAYFMVLPFLQTLGRPPDEQLQVRSVGVMEEPPPPSQIMEEVEPEEEKKPELDQLDEQPLDLSELELALNPGGGDWGGNFTISLDRHISKAGREETIFSMGDLDQKPRAIYQPAPTYPPELHKKGLEGTVYVIFIIDRNGRVTNAKVQKSTHQAFERPALAAVRKWKFDPGKRGGKAVQFRMRVPITFSLG